MTSKKERIETESQEKVSSSCRCSGQLLSARSFGAIVITKPFNDLNIHDQFRIYTLNPDVVKSWAGPELQVDQITACASQSVPPSADIRLLYNVNEFRIRRTPNRQYDYSRGLNELWWVENDSGNELMATTDLWKHAP
jgi:hypothetical protein